MSKRRIVLSITFVSVLGALSSCAGAPARTQQQAAVEPDAPSAIMKTDWMSALPEAMSDEICNQEGVFRQCFPLSAEECQQQVRSATVSCEQTYQAEIPSQLLESDTQSWGGRIGECAGNTMFQTLDARYPVAGTDSCRQALSQM